MIQLCISTRKITAFIGLSAAMAFSAHSQSSLQTYFDFTTYGTQSGGASIVDQSGNSVTATLNTEAHTSLTASGLGITAGGNCNATGLTIGSANMSVFTGAFTIQDWVTLSAVANNQMLFGAGNGPVNTYIGDGITISDVFGAVRGGAVSAVVGGRTPNYQRYGYGVADGSFVAATATLYDIVYTWDGTDFKEYVNGALMGTRNMPTFGSLAQASSAGFVIGGAKNEPWNDAALAQTTSDFLLYTGALTAGQISSLNGVGAGASVSTINSIIAVPEPCTMALSALGGLAMLMIRQRSKH
jgi:hypothetical protein